MQELKEKNKINTNNMQLRDNLEWIAPQEKPFTSNGNADNKIYFIVWRENENGSWRFTNFINIPTNIGDRIHIDTFNEYQLWKENLGKGTSLYVEKTTGFIKYVAHWSYDDGKYFKSVYRWNLDEMNKPNLDIDNNGNVIEK